MKQRKNRWQPLVVLAVLAVFMTVIYFMDNKYQTPPPYGKSGIITLNEKDFERERPIFLIDGWLLSDGHIKDKPTYIGEFSNLQRGDLSVLPHGETRYQLTLRYYGNPKIVSVDFWQLSSQYTVFFDGNQCASGIGNGRITFLLTQGDHVLAVETSSKAGYYSGMYFPPALGTEVTIGKMEHIQSFAYSFAFILPLALAAFTLFLWRTGGKLSCWFGIMCCCYALYMFRYFVFLLSMPVAQYWFLVQNLSLYCLCYCVVKLTVLVSGECGKWRVIRVVLIVLPSVLILLSIFIPILPWAVFVHGRLTDVYYIFTFVAAVFFAMHGLSVQSWECRYTIVCCVVFGSGMLINLFFSNNFEPILFFWQFEWCGLLLVLLFAAMMVSYNRRIMRENDELTNHMEEQVNERTKEVTQLLDERKAFFSDMAHDLKAPVFATQSFIQAIRRSGVGVDMELMGYLDLAEQKQREMARRLQGLSTINELDRIESERVKISLNDELEEIYAIYHGEAEVRSVYLYVEPPIHDVFLMAQPEKFSILFENLIYNAFRATPQNGKITISANILDGKLRITVEDSGCGIPEEELPHIFRRFYVGSSNREYGTGLGLYIVHNIVTELGGTIYVKSIVGEGTKFIMEFPQYV